jgi:hypothetical protein
MVFGFGRTWPDFPPGLRLPQRGIVVATWNPIRNGWQYSDYTPEWRQNGLGHCIRLFKRMVPYEGSEQAVLAQNGVVYAYKWYHTTRWQAQGMASGGRWHKEATKTTGYVLRRCQWLRMLGIVCRKV